MFKYYFQELCRHVREDLVKQALEHAGHYQHNLCPRQELLDDIDDYINRHNNAQTIPEWVETVLGFSAWSHS